MANTTFTISETSASKRRFPLFLVDVTDGYTPETGEAGGQPQISINGGSFGNTNGILVHVGNGYYYVELTVSELSSLGHVNVRYKSANTREFQDIAFVEPGGDNSIDDLKTLMLRNLRKSNRIEQLLKDREEALLTELEHKEFL